MTLEHIDVTKRMAQLGRAVIRATGRKVKKPTRVKRADAMTLEHLKTQKGLSMAAFAKRFVP